MMRVDPEILEAIYTQKDENLLELSQRQPVLLIFLRHFGCTFCKQTMSDLAKVRAEIEAKGLLPIIVHMAPEELANKRLHHFNLPDIGHVSDPDLSLYAYFGLKKGTFSQLYGLKVVVGGMKALAEGFSLPSISKEYGSISQMPGVFVLEAGEVKLEFIHSTAAERADYMQIVADYLALKVN
ncbi:SelL-related redox protein [Saprospira sp. CCB-QB6]|uniref:SelL-related redox protein n=1 Tax=Saprospira sp. CCB-QB6 TaxID=3023936 RepID=UPI00234A1B84|nr:SelL-related redox protein [Saprospira sp. CCB-QB6]WCL81428.1 SelL-related redox protein [Saprospira sp. CCB-QB6]